jgi:hypothetical protein
MSCFFGTTSFACFYKWQWKQATNTGLTKSNTPNYRGGMLSADSHCHHLIAHFTGVCPCLDFSKSAHHIKKICGTEWYERNEKGIIYWHQHACQGGSPRADAPRCIDFWAWQ